MKDPQQLQFQGAAESKGFRPVEQASSTGLVKEYADYHLQKQASALDAESRNLDQVGRANIANNSQTFKELASFSSTLSEYLQEDQKKRNESQEEEGLLLAYSEGLPEETTKAFDENEAKLASIDATTRTLAADVEATGGSPFVAERFRNLSGWKGFGYAKGLAQQAGINYPTYYAQASQKVSVDLNGQAVTLATARTPEERSAVETRIRQGYLRQFVGMNPALLNKHLFPQMQSHEARQAVEWADKQAGILKEERKAESQDVLFTGIKAGNGGATLVQFVNQYAGDFGGIGGSRKMASELLSAMVKTRQIGQAEVEALLNYRFTAKDGSNVRLGDYWGRDFSSLNDELKEASRIDLQQELQAKKDAEDQFRLEFDKATAERAGKGWSEGELVELAKSWTEKGMGSPPSWLTEHLSVEDRDNKSDTERLMALRQSRGYLTEEDLRGVDPTVYGQMIGYVKEDNNLSTPTKGQLSDADELIGAFAKDYNLIENGVITKTPKFFKATQMAKARYETYFRENIRGGMDPQLAHDKAMKRVENNFKAGSYAIEEVLPINTQAERDLKKATAALGTNPNLVNTGVIPGTEAALQQARKYAETRKGELPLIYRQLAQEHRGLTAWDIANAQLQAAGMGGLVKPKIEQWVDKQDPVLKRLLTWRPTTARTTRVALQTGWKPFLDLIASKESMSYGEYDAMNKSGAAGGTVAFGSANSTNVFGRGLSQMTIGEVMQLQANGSLHASGRYQIIGSTLKGLIKRKAGGLTANDLYSPENQDKLAIELAKARLAQRNVMTGMRNEWVGLTKVSDAVLQNAISRITVQSPYNQPENLLPRLIYKIGSRGYGSTGPHLDVKPVKSGTMQTSASLPAITATELDRYLKVGDKKLPLSQGTVTTDNDALHRNRGSFGHDFAAPDGTPVFADPRVKVIGSSKGDGGTDHLVIELPDGRRYQLLHGVKA